MLLPIVLLSGMFQLGHFVSGQEYSVIRHADGDLFAAEGSCPVACVELSSGTASPYARFATATSTGFSISNGTCICQCNPALPVFREDLHICVSDIHECSVTGFMNNPGIVEKVPYVFMPQRGQIIYPQAEIRFEGVVTPVCGIAGAQQLGRSGWLELRNLSNAESPFRLFRDEGRTFLQWVGESGLKETAEGKVVVVRLVCRDAAPNTNSPGVFVPCVAFRVAGSPSKNNVREVTFASAGHNSQGLSVLEYIAIGISSAVLAIIYVASVFLYLNSRKARSKPPVEPEVVITGGGGGRDGAGIVKNNPLLVASRHFESDTSNGLGEEDLGEDVGHSDGEQAFENQVTSAIVHPYCMYMEYPEGPFGTGSIIGERIPEEDVRIVETIENTQQHDTPALPGTQRRKLYFNPAYFERQLLLSPPPAAVEFLLKIREVIAIAKHKMDAKRFVPTLIGIPEEDNASDRCSPTNKQRAGSVQGSVARSRKSQRCTGCPGCTGPPSKNLPMLPDSIRPMVGDSRVRAWLEDVKLPERRWKDAQQDNKRHFQESARTFAKSLEYLKEIATNDFSQLDKMHVAGKSLATWKDNPPMLRSFQNIARSEILGEDDRNSISRRSTKSMFEETNHHRANESGPSSLDVSRSEDTINTKVRKAIENSFIKQMEENAFVQDGETRTPSPKQKKQQMLDSDRATISSSKKSSPNQPSKRSRKPRAPSVPAKELPDMINELPTAMIPPKRIMDAVIKEMVDAKVLDHHPRIANRIDYEVDSLERSHRKVIPSKKKVSPSVTQRRSPKLTIAPESEDVPAENRAVPAAESKRCELDMRMIQSESQLNEDVMRKNYYNLPELLAQRPEGYSLVSEVYVNDGYASPAGSDDSGPEIRYEPENPGHLTIKVQDSPENYVKQDDSEYEPDTLDRKPMRLKINGDVIYDRDLAIESYVDSLERPSQIMLRSKCSFRNEGDAKSGPLHRGYGSLREIYEARFRANLKDSNLMGSTRSLNGDLDDTMSWKKKKYLTPDTRQAKRQRKPQNRPDVVPPLPPTEEIYQQPKPPRRVEYVDCNGESSNASRSKNERGRSCTEAGDPTASYGTPVLRTIRQQCVGMNSESQGFVIANVRQQRPAPGLNSARRELSRRRIHSTDSTKRNETPVLQTNPSWRSSNYDPPWKIEFERRSRHLATAENTSQCRDATIFRDRCGDICVKTGTTTAHRRDDNYPGKTMENADPVTRTSFGELPQKSLLPSSAVSQLSSNAGKVEDCGYLSSTDSSGSQKNLLRYEFGSVSETDETESICDGASESGAESVGTDSVFFGNFRRLSNVSNFSKSIDSGVDVGMKHHSFVKTVCSGNDLTSIGPPIGRSSAHPSDSECESFITVLPLGNASRRNSLVL